MRTKRKRACRKPRAKKPAVVAQSENVMNPNEEAFLSFVNQNNKEKSVSADSNDLEVIGKTNTAAADAKSSSSSSSLSLSSESDESLSAEERSSGNSSAVDMRSRKSTKRRGNGKQKANKLSKKGRNDDVKSSRVLRSSSKKQNDLKMPQPDPRYNKEELKAALEVIRKVMKLDEAQPFNVPVDPVALGKPDYFNMIDTPMDFGTICGNLENSIKYMNAEDVLNDVKYIWENCCKWNKKGAYIVYLMKRVKKKFMKYWTAAGLSIEKSRKIDVGTSYDPSTTDYARRHSLHETYPVGHAQPPPSTAQPQFSQLPPVSYHQPSQLQHPRAGTNQAEFSQLQAHTVCNSAGYSHFQPPKDIALKHKKHISSPKHKKNTSLGPSASVFGEAPGHSHLQQPQLSHKQPYGLQQQQSISQLQPSQLQAVADGGYSRIQPPIDKASKYKKHASNSKHNKNASVDPAGPIDDVPPSHSQSQQPQLSHKQPYGLLQHQQSISHNQPSQLQAVTDGGHPHLLPKADYRRFSGYVPTCPVDPTVVGPGQSQHRQSPLSNDQSSEPQEVQPQTSHCLPPSSPLQDNIDNEHSHLSLTDSALRGIRCALRYSAGPTTNKSNQANKDQSGPIDLHPEQTTWSQEQPHHLPLLPKRKKRGRGPTRCLFLNNLGEGERIFVHINNLGQPVGPEASKLSSFLGTIARNGHRAPLNFVHWRAMPDSYKEEMWEYVQTKFVIDPLGKSWVMQSLATKWRDWKADLKASYFDALKTDEDRLKVNDPRVVPDQWPSLIEYWNSEDTKKRCATNKANRAKMKGAHASGTKSYARIREEERNKRPDGKELSRAELYILTHTRKDGQPVDEIAATYIEKLREQATNKQITSQCSEESNDTLCQVMGAERGNHVRTYGLGINRTDVFGPRPSRHDLLKMASEAKKSANEEVHKMVVKIEAMEEKYARMETHIARMASNMEKFLGKIGGSSNILGSQQDAKPDKE